MAIFDLLISFCGLKRLEFHQKPIQPGVVKHDKGKGYQQPTTCTYNLELDIVVLYVGLVSTFWTNLQFPIFRFYNY